MEKQSGSGRKQSSGTSPGAGRITKKQKTAVTTTDMAGYYNSQPTGSFSLTQISQSQTPNIQLARIQPSISQSQGMDQQEIQMSGTNASQIAQMKDQLAQAQNQIKTLQKKIRKVHETRQVLDKYMNNEDKTMNELIEKQNIFKMHRTLVQEKTAALNENLKASQKSKNELNDFYNNVILKQDQRIKELKAELDQQNSSEEKELAEPLRLMEEKLARTRIQCQEASDRLGIMSSLVDEMDVQEKELDKMISENQRIYDEEIETLSAIGKDIDVNLEIEREEKSKLLARRDESSRRLEELTIKFQALEENAVKSEKQIQDLKSSAQEMREKNKRLRNEVDAQKSINDTIISKRDLELVENRKQQQGLLSRHKETIDKLSKMNLNHEKLLDTEAKAVERNEELKKALLDKSNEMTQLVKAQDAAQERNKELTTRTQHLAEELIARKKVLLEREADLDACNATRDDNGTRESELITRLATAKRELQDKIDYKAKLLKEISDAELRFVGETKKLEFDVELKNKKLAELKKIEENLRLDGERVASEDERKLQQLTNLTSQCQKAGHEDLMKEQDIRIDLLQHQIKLQELKFKEEDMAIAEADREEKEKREAQVKEMESKIKNVEKAISDNQELQEDLKNIMKKAQTPAEAKATVIADSSNSSELLTGMMFAQHKSIPTSSTPERSPQRNRIDLFGFESLMDDTMSSIEGTDIFEAAKRNYAAYQQSQKEIQKSSQNERTDT